MSLAEPGKNEEHIEEASSAGLSESETDAAPANAVADEPAVETPSETTATDGEETPPSAGQPVETDDTDEEPEPESDAQTDDDDDDDEDVPAASDDAADEDEPGEDETGRLKRGMLIEGTITRATPTAIHVDLGDDMEGVVPGRELETMQRKLLDDLQEGTEVTVYVVNPRNHQGQIVLSINHALEETDWRDAEDYRKSKEIYSGHIGGYNKGGLIVRFGRLRGFVPQSQIGDKRMRRMKGDTPEERYGKFVNDEINVKVMEVDRSRNRLILSERQAMREIRQQRKEALIGELAEGEIREGRVVSLENFGAFVDIGGAEGLVHLTELSWRHVTHPRQTLSVGEEVRVKVISVDPGQNRIGLSIKQLKPDPWDEIAALYGNGSLVKATVTKLTRFGAFARLHGEVQVEGLIHISELSEDRVEHPRDVVNKNDVLTLRVVKVDVKNRRLGLSLKRVNSAEYLDQDMERAFVEAARIQQERKEKAADEPAPETAEEPAEESVEAVAEATPAEDVAPVEDVSEAPDTPEAEADIEEPEASVDAEQDDDTADEPEAEADVEEPEASVDAEQDDDTADEPEAEASDDTSDADDDADSDSDDDSAEESDD